MDQGGRTQTTGREPDDTTPINAPDDLRRAKGLAVFRYRLFPHSMPPRFERRRGALPPLLAIVKYKQGKCKLKMLSDRNFRETHGKPS